MNVGGGNQLSYQDIISTQMGFQRRSKVVQEKEVAVLDVDLARKTGYFGHSKNRNLEMDYLKAQDSLHQYSMMVVDLEEKCENYKDQNEKLKKGLECGICLQTFSVPITLPCSHTYCYECILHCFAPPTGKGSDKTFFQVEKCPLCRASIRLEMTPSIVMRDMASVALRDDPVRLEKVGKDLEKLKRHLGCIRLGAHCSGKMCLRPRVTPKPPKTSNTAAPQPAPPNTADVPPIINPDPQHETPQQDLPRIVSVSQLPPLPNLDHTHAPASVQDSSTPPAAEPC